MSKIENSENKDKIIEKEQNAINDFIANLDKEVYKDFSIFPLKLPMKLDNPDSIELDDFILLKIQEDYYLFPKSLKNNLLDYISFKKYFANHKRPKESKYLQKILYIIGTLLVLSLFVFSDGALLTLILFIYFQVEFFDRDIQIAEYTQKQTEFTKLLSELRKLQFPLEFFDKNDRYLDVSI